jgi:adenylate cyclase
MQNAAPDPRRAVSDAVGRVLAEEARRNEVRVAWVRVAGFGAVSVLDTVMAARGLRPVENVPQSLAALLLSIGALAALRRAPFQRWYPLALPVLDAAILAMVLESRIARLGPSVALVATTALVCGLFAMTGALRFARRAATWTTVLAAALFLFLLGPHGDAPVLVYSLVALAAIGLLAMWLADRVRASMEGAASRAFLQRFLPAELVANAFEHPRAALAAPRVLDATVLVSDLRDFTALAERVPPDVVFDFLSELQGELARVVEAHGGTVDKFLGDGMLAVFAGEGGHPRRAVAAARDIRVVVRRLDARGLLGAPVRVGIGVHCGTLVAGCLGSGDRLESTVIGDTVNTASRLEGLTKENGVDVLLSEAVVSRAGDVGAVLLGEVRVRGRERELRVYTLPVA